MANGGCHGTGRGAQHEKAGKIIWLTGSSGQPVELDSACYVDPPLTPLSSDQIEAIHEASLDILDSVGIMFLNDEALDILASAGCDVNRSTKIVGCSGCLK